MRQDGEWVPLPLLTVKVKPSIHEVNEVSAQQMSRMIKNRTIDRAFLGSVRLVETCTEGSENVPKEEFKEKWRQDLPDAMKVVLEEYDDVFPADLPPGLPPIREGFEFTIHLDDDACYAPAERCGVAQYFGQRETHSNNIPKEKITSSANIPD